ncbi:hypothetical protein NQ314_016589 [Rhamnusium bicolor]|uniref:Uncharacterized protein n=1 Tax=Rhamnusium bicolor TaxID=1586634 RepID=A0AAV8WVA9_9CUCU|nr:hypothetical protein NQ314_016589 [Rhamnusium bicolor]
MSSCNLSINEILSNQIKKFWEQEEVTQNSIRSREENECETHFQNSFSRKTDGRFSMKLPFKENIHTLADSRNMALNRFLGVEKRFTRDSQLKITTRNL